MRIAFNHKTKIGLFAGVLLCIVLAVNIFSMKTTYVFAQESSENYFDKISIYSNTQQISFKGMDGLRSAIDGLRKNPEAIEAKEVNLT